MNQDFDKARAHFLDGVQHFEAGRMEAAEADFLASLALLPGRASTRINLAATRLRLGRAARALADLEAVLDAEPQHLDAWCHRAAALAELGRDVESLQCAEHVLSIDAAHGTALYRRGMALDRLRRFAEALACFERLASLQPEHSEAWFRQGQLLQRLGRWPQALQALDRALALAPTHAPAWSQRGGLLKDMGRADEAASAFEQAIAHGADAELQRFFIASLGRQTGPAHAPRQYVQALFDDYADSFDEHLVDVLGYQAHRRLVAPLPALHAQPFESALDLGCGTGLCGPLLKPPSNPIVRQLHGVDLSRPMLDRAAALGVYDSLVQSDLIEYLQATLLRHDLVLACDVFIYVGALDEVFAAVARVLNQGGVFCFSAEHGPDERPVTLHAHLRYAHSLPYLHDLAQRHGLQCLQVLHQPIRQDQTQAIPGLYVYLRKP